MVSIDLQEVCVDFPVYTQHARSLRHHLMQVATGGRLSADSHGYVTVRALDQITLSLKEGDRVGLIGHNGAGKSTMLRLLGRIYEPTSGSAKIQGEISSLMDVSLGIDADATGRENIYIRATLLGIPRATIKHLIDEVITFSELGDFIDMPLRTYSTGMHMRLTFAVSTMLQPEILLMDEWLSVGDESFKHKAEARLMALVQKSNIMVIASHSHALIQRTCNRAVWLEHGKIHMDGDVHAVTKAYFEGV